MRKDLFVYSIDVVLASLIISMFMFVGYGLVFGIMILLMPFMIDLYIVARACYLNEEV
jgi:hypothetical protein